MKNEIGYITQKIKKDVAFRRVRSLRGFLGRKHGGDAGVGAVKEGFPMGAWLAEKKVGEAGGGEGVGVVLHEGAAGGVDALHAGERVGELGGGEEFVELVEGDAVELAEFGDGDGGVEEVGEEGEGISH